MSGKLTINKITNCEDLTIHMDNATVVGNYSSLEINDVRDSKRTTISMKDMKVMTQDEYYRRKAGAEGGHSRWAGGGPSHSGGQLTVNKVQDCIDTKIDQDRMKIKGPFSDVKINEVARSKQTAISMRGADISVGDDSDDSDDDSDSGENGGNNSDFDEDGLPKPSTYEYYVAEKFTFSIRLGGGANVTCTFLKKDRVRTIKKFIVELQPHFKNKAFRLQEHGKDGAYVDNDPEATLEKAGFKDKIDLKTVIVSPESDYYQ